jgi:regulator-associated protein of mTOR
MWAQWDLAVDACLRQLPDLLGNEETVFQNPKDSTYIPDKPYTYVPSRFFTDHLTAFEVWVSRGGSALTKRGPGSLAPATGSDGAEIGISEQSDGSNGPKLVPRKPPEQLPILLQLLLSQPHRLRALILLSQFVDLGPWAVHFALAIGVFPFISKLLQSPAHDLRPVLIFIWARILAVDPSCQNDLYHSQGYKYFANALAARQDVSDRFPNMSEHAAMCCFILSAICRGFPQGQTACWQERVFDNCFERLEEDDFLSRQWMALCIGQMWDGNDDIKIYGVDRGTQDKLIAMLADNSAEVRTAALFALGTFMGASSSADSNRRGGGGTGSMYHLDERTHFRLEVAVGTGAALTTRDDASPMVRKELLVLLSCLVKEWRGYFVIAAWTYWEEEHKRLDGSQSPHDEDIVSQAISDWLDDLSEDEAYREDSRVLLSSFYTIYVFLLEMSVDPYPEVAAYAQTIVDYIMALLLESPFARSGFSTLNKPPPTARERKTSHPSEPRSRIPSLQSTTRPPFATPSRIPLTRSDSTTSALSSGSSNILRRTASFANSLKSLAGSYAFPSSNSDDTAVNSTGPSGLRVRGEYTDISCPPSPNLNVAEYCSPYMGRSPDSPAQSPVMPPEQNSTPDYLPCEVMEALIEEDMERLRARRRKKSQPRLYQQYAHSPDNMPSPSGSTFSHDSAGSSGSVPLGLGTGAGFKDVLPLKSKFYDWCCEYFTETQMRVSAMMCTVPCVRVLMLRVATGKRRTG